MVSRRLACVLAAAIAVAAFCACVLDPAATPTSVPTATPTPLPTPTPVGYDDWPQCAECPAVRVERIIDGDTLDTSASRVRLYGIDAPERDEPCGYEATERLQELSGSRVRLESGPRPEDVHGRRLAYLYTEDGRSIDAALVWGGYVRAWTSDGQHRGELLALERDARTEGRGCLW